MHDYIAWWKFISIWSYLGVWSIVVILSQTTRRFGKLGKISTRRNRNQTRKSNIQPLFQPLYSDVYDEGLGCASLQWVLKTKITDIKHGIKTRLSGPYLERITSGKWVGTQNEKHPNRAMQKKISNQEITSNKSKTNDPCGYTQLFPHRKFCHKKRFSSC